MTLQQALDVCDWSADKLYGISHAVFMPVLPWYETTDINRTREYVIIRDLATCEWIPIHMRQACEMPYIDKQLTDSDSVILFSNLVSIARCSDNWQPLTRVQLYALNKLAWNDIPHGRRKP